MKVDTSSFLPGISVDCVLFGFHARSLRVLLLKLKNADTWSLPGGFVYRDEDVDAAARRVLKERTGLGEIVLRQFHLFGKVGRVPNDHADRLEALGLADEERAAWFRQRFISMGYFALVEYSLVQSPTLDPISELCEWVEWNELPPMMLDHRDIALRAREALRKEILEQPVAISLLPKRFTMPELQALFETVLGRQLDRRNFQRKMQGHGIVNRTNERRQGGAHKSPWLYEFDEEQYSKACDQGLGPLA
jgi:8-oxo-dGTP diphosphatase